MINKKNLKKVLIIICLILIIAFAIIKISSTLAKYKSEVSLTRENVDIALWMVNENMFNNVEKVVIQDIYPNDNYFEYVFSVSNYNGEFRAETDIEYYLKCETTTNLPLEYKFLYKTNDGNWQECYKTDILSQKSQKYNNNNYETYIRKISITKTNQNEKFLLKYTDNNTDYFKIQIKFPKKYNKEEYADLVENIQLELIAEQAINEYNN